MFRFTMAPCRRTVPLLAAHRAGMKEIIIPSQNEADLDDVPEVILQELEVHLAMQSPKFSTGRWS